MLKKRKVGGGIVIRNNNETSEILLIQRSSKDHWPLRWETPRGGCDKFKEFESIIDCIKREVKEESGLDVIPVQFIDRFDYLSKEKNTLTTQHNYLCKLKDKNQEVKLSKEHQDYKWIPTVNHAQIQLLVSTKEMYHSIMKALDMITKDGININIPIQNTIIKECILKLEKIYNKK